MYIIYVTERDASAVKVGQITFLTYFSMQQKLYINSAAVKFHLIS